jgi:hypothetical protein
MGCEGQHSCGLQSQEHTITNQMSPSNTTHHPVPASSPVVKPWWGGVDTGALGYGLELRPRAPMAGLDEPPVGVGLSWAMAGAGHIMRGNHFLLAGPRPPWVKALNVQKRWSPT